jgi:hypothetical protein
MSLSFRTKNRDVVVYGDKTEEFEDAFEIQWRRGN